MIDLVGKIVEVITTETSYIGKLIEIGEKEVYLESDMGWIMVPVEKIMSIIEAEKD